MFKHFPPVGFKHCCNIQDGFNIALVTTQSPSLLVLLGTWRQHKSLSEEGHTLTHSSSLSLMWVLYSLFLFMPLFIFCPINCVWHTTMKANHTVAACFCQLLYFLISNEDNMRNCSYPLAVFSALMQSLLLPPCGSFYRLNVGMIPCSALRNYLCYELQVN